MNSRSAARVGTLSGLVGLGGLLAGDSLAFDPEAGLTVTKQFSLYYEMQIEDFAMEVDGEDIGAMIGVPEMVMEGENLFAFTDTYVEVEDGRPLVLVRSYEEALNEMDMTISVMGQSDDQSMSADAAIVGSTVRFTWDPDAEVYDREFAEGSEGDPDRLARLEEDTDLRMLLPGREVVEGDEWEVGCVFLKHLLMPGGDLGWDPSSFGLDEDELEEMEAFIEPMMERSMQLYDDLLVGNAKATYLGTEELDGSRVGLVGIEIDMDTTIDMTSWLEEMIGIAMEAVGDVPEDFMLDIGLADVGMVVTGEGILRWDLERDLLHGLDLEVDTDWMFELEANGGAMGEYVDISFLVAGSGPYEVEVTTEYE